MKFKHQQINVIQVQIDNLNIADFATNLGNHLKKSHKDFFKDSVFIIDFICDEIPQIPEIKKLKDVFKKHNLLLIGLSHKNFKNDDFKELDLVIIPQKNKKNNNLQELNIPKLVEENKNLKNQNSQKLETKNQNLSDKNLVIRKHIRSGQVIKCEGDLTIVGTVSYGSELIAGGNIYVLGTLRGRAFAGNNGNENAIIYCHEIDAELISIAGNFLIKEQFLNKEKIKNCLINLDENKQINLNIIK